MKNAWGFVTFSYLLMMWCLSTGIIINTKSCALVQNMSKLLQIADTYNFRTLILEWKFHSCHNCNKYTRMYSNQYLCGICTLEIHFLHLNIFPCPHTVGDPVFSRFEVLRVTSLRIQVFCDVTLWQWVTGSWCLWRNILPRSSRVKQSKKTSQYRKNCCDKLVWQYHIVDCKAGKQANQGRCGRGLVVFWSVGNPSQSDIVYQSGRPETWIQYELLHLHLGTGQLYVIIM